MSGWSSTRRIPTGRRSGFGAPMSQSRTNAASTPPCSRPRRRWSSWRSPPPAPTAWTRRRRARPACRSPMSPAMPRTAWPNMRSPCCLRSRAPCRPMTAPWPKGAGRRRAVSACSTIRSSTSPGGGSALSARASSAPRSRGRPRRFGHGAGHRRAQGRAAPGPGQVAFDEMLATSDAISIHCPLNDETRGLIGRAEFAAMRRRPFLINTARGGIVDEAALAEALDGGAIRGAAFDVATVEPPPEGHPLPALAGRPNVIVTPHVAWASEEGHGRPCRGPGRVGSGSLGARRDAQPRRLTRRAASGEIHLDPQIHGKAGAVQCPSSTA